MLDFNLISESRPTHKLDPKPTPKRKQPPQHPIDQVWLRLRRPFRYPPAGHACVWERYDADRAGCVLCGRLHLCAGCMVGCSCPLVETDEGGHVCQITGLCVAEVRAAAGEFVSHVSYEQPREPLECDMHARVHSIVVTFLQAPATAACLRREQAKNRLRLRQAFWRVLRQRNREEPYRLPCLCSVVATVAHSDQTLLRGVSRESAARVAASCARGIAAGMAQLCGLGFRKAGQSGKFYSMVLGMLYLSRTGLSLGRLFHLPAVQGVEELLPGETYLHTLGVSNKVICDTENEIKSCVRAHLGQ